MVNFGGGGCFEVIVGAGGVLESWLPSIVVAGVELMLRLHKSSSSSSKLVKVESDDKLLMLPDLDFPGGLSTASSFLTCPSPCPTRRATCKQRMIPTFLAFQSALTQNGQCRVSVDDPVGIALAQDGVVHGLGEVVVAPTGMAGFVAVEVLEGTERCGIGRGREMRHLMDRGEGPETGVILHLGPGRGRFLTGGGLVAVGLVVRVLVERDDEAGTDGGETFGARHWLARSRT